MAGNPEGVSDVDEEGKLQEGVEELREAPTELAKKELEFAAFCDRTRMAEGGTS